MFPEGSEYILLVIVIVAASCAIVTELKAEMKREMNAMKREMKREMNVMKTEIKTEEKRIKKNSCRSKGEYFETTDVLWKKEPKRVDDSAKDTVTLIMTRIRGMKTPNFLDFCKVPPKNIISESDLRVPDPTWRLAMTKREIRCNQNIFQTRAAASPKNNAGSGYNSWAHAVPAGVPCSVVWGTFLELLTGEKGTDLQRLLAVHGVWSHYTQYGGVKNVPQNLLALPPGHGRYFDASGAGNLVIIPIVDLNKGETEVDSYYDLIAVARNKGAFSWMYDGEMEGSADFYSDLFDEGVEEASEEDITVATDFLVKYIMAVAYIGKTSKLNDTGFQKWLMKMSADIVPMKCDHNGEEVVGRRAKRSDQSDQSEQSSNTVKHQQKNFSKAAKAFDDIESKGVYVPKLDQSNLKKHHVVMKVKLKVHFEKHEIPLASYPAWSLLGLKAAANWFVYAGQSIVPCCTDLDEEAVPVFAVENEENSVESSLGCGDSCDELDDDSLFE